MCSISRSHSQSIHESHGITAINNQRRYENVQSFIKVVQDLNVPSDSTFSYEDLTSDGDQERPRVADCVLWLKRIWEHKEASGGNPQQANDLSPSWRQDSTRKAAVQLQSARSSGLYQPSGKEPMSARTSNVYQPSCKAAAEPAAKGVAVLLNHWSTVLKHNMASTGAPAATLGGLISGNPAEFGIDSMGEIHIDTSHTHRRAISR